MDLQLSGLWGAIVAFLITLIVQKLLIPVSSRFNLLDHPAGRKDHAEPTPVTGGVAMLAGLVLASVLTLPAIHAPLGGFLGAATLLVVVGLLDDKYDLDWRLRILAQILAALIMIYFGGIRVHYLGHLFGHENLVLGSLSVPFTVFATVGIINAVNMIDGADGLAGLLVLAALVMLSAATVYSGNQALLTHLLLAIGAVCGFLLFNLRHRWQQSAKSFMGNSGNRHLCGGVPARGQRGFPHERLRQQCAQRIRTMVVGGGRHGCPGDAAGIGRAGQGPARVVAHACGIHCPGLRDCGNDGNRRDPPAFDG